MNSSIILPMGVLVYMRPASIPAKCPIKEALGTSKCIRISSAQAAYFFGMDIPWMYSEPGGSSELVNTFKANITPVKEICCINCKSNKVMQLGDILNK